MQNESKLPLGIKIIIGFHLLNPDYELANPKPSITTKLNKIIEEEGVESAKETFSEIIENHADDYDMNEHSFIRLGYRYIKEGKTMEAVALFELYVETYPESWNAYDSYADALKENKEIEKAIENYKKSLELNPENINAIVNIQKIGFL